MSNKLVLEVLADSNGLIKGLNQAQSAVDKFMKSSATAGSALGSGVNRALESFKALAGGGAAAAGILAGAIVGVSTASVAMTIVAGKQAEALSQMSSMTGIGTDTLQKYDVLLNRVGLDGSDLTSMMKTLSTNMENAKNGTGSAADRFKQLGIDITKVTSTNDLIQKIAESVSKFRNGTEKAAIMADLLGKQGLKFIPAFEGGAAAIREAALASEQLGASLSSGQLAELGQMDDRIDDLTVAWQRFGQQIGAFVAPAIDFAAKALANLLSMASHGLKSLNAMGGVNAPADVRKAPPALIDTAKQSAQAQALIDAQLKAKEGLFSDQEALARAALANQMAILDQEKAYGIKTDMEVGQARQKALAQMDAVTDASLKKQLENYRVFIQQKSALFPSDEKGQAARAVFLQEAATKEKKLINEISIAYINADTTRIQSGLAVKTFWQQQLQDIVASNTFSMGLIVNTWTSGIANSIVNGGNFAKAAWQSTQIAIIQGGLNTVVQWGAQQALMVAQTTATATATTGIWAGASTAISGFFATTSAAFTAMVANMVAVVTAVGEFIMGVLSAIAEALTDTIFGIPWAGAIVVGIALIAAALAATGNLGFKDGGIGDFGSGTPATLHGEEAIIPLNRRGASFLQSAMGGTGRSSTIIVPVKIDGREVARATARHTPSAWRSAGAPA